jgi:hypothetical protein
VIICESFAMVAAGESILVTRGAPRLHHLIEALHSGERNDYATIFEEHDSELLE